MCVPGRNRDQEQTDDSHAFFINIVTKIGDGVWAPNLLMSGKPWLVASLSPCTGWLLIFFQPVLPKSCLDLRHQASTERWRQRKRLARSHGTGMRKIYLIMWVHGILHVQLMIVVYTYGLQILYVCSIWAWSQFYFLPGWESETSHVSNRSLEMLWRQLLWSWVVIRRGTAAETSIEWWNCHWTLRWSRF